MTPDQFPCGPQSWEAKAIPRILSIHCPQFVFRGACAFHDQRYTIGGYDVDRRDADRLFYALMIDALAGRPLISRVYFRFWAWIFYRAVRHYGKAYFNYRSAK